MNLKLELIFKDRIGIVADISVLLARQKLNIVSMEVERKEAQAFVYVETEGAAGRSNREEILKIIGRISDLLEVGFIDTLPQEERENRFRVVLDNISDGVISIDKDGKVTTINQIAQTALNCSEAEAVGQSIQMLKLSDYLILECLKGKTYNNIKQNLITGTGRYQYLADVRPIRDSSGRIIGAVEIAKDVQEIKKLAKTISEAGQFGFSDIIGRNPAIVEAISFAQKIAGTDSIVSLRGGSGTGKEMFARAIHTASVRPGPFVPVNCAALPEQLLESELFGYARGAFTGGRKEGKAGLFEIAGGGTILLDEIAEMPLSSQAKILRVIQDKCVRRIGGSDEIPVDTRILTSTNRHLEQLVDEKKFRQVLYYRINVLPIHIPPLAERKGDLPVLVDHFLFQLASKLGKQVPAVSQEAQEKLSRHDWPGNVRELKNVVERAAILCEESEIDVGGILFSYELGRNIKYGVVGPSGESGKTRPLKEAVNEYEKRLLAETLGQARSIRQAARTLGLSHTALLNKMKKYGLKR